LSGLNQFEPTENQQHKTMKQVEATPERPFYSVAYQYEHNPYTLFSHHHFFGLRGRTMRGTDNLEQAKKQADKLVMEPGICYAQVSVTTDCYNHSQVYKVYSNPKQSNQKKR
jgi:hypothetical protein